MQEGWHKDVMQEWWHKDVMQEWWHKDVMQEWWHKQEWRKIALGLLRKIAVHYKIFKIQIFDFVSAVKEDEHSNNRPNNTCIIMSIAIFFTTGVFESLHSAMQL